MDKKIIKADKNLKAMALSIFGNIISECYVCTFYFGNSDKNEGSERINKEAFRKIDAEIDNGAKDIIIIFSNGNAVLFTNSEWGSISRIDLGKDTVQYRQEKQHKCERCGSTVNVTFEPDPYASETNDDDTEVWECESCRQENADDV